MTNVPARKPDFEVVIRDTPPEQPHVEDRELTFDEEAVMMTVACVDHDGFLCIQVYVHGDAPERITSDVIDQLTRNYSGRF